MLKITEAMFFFSLSENNTTTTGTIFISVLAPLSLCYGSHKCLNCSFLGLMNTSYNPYYGFWKKKKKRENLNCIKNCQSYFSIIFQCKLECWHIFYSFSVIYIFNKVAYLLKYTLPLTHGLCLVAWILCMPGFTDAHYFLSVLSHFSAHLPQHA